MILLTLQAPAGQGLGGANLVEMKRVELRDVEGGIWREIAKKLLESAIIGEAIGMIEDGINDFRNGWNSHQC